MISALRREAQALSPGGAEPVQQASFPKLPSGQVSLPAQLRFPVLEGILAHAEYQYHEPQASEEYLWSLLGYPLAPAPVAAAGPWLIPELAPYQSSAAESYWLRADPVWLRADLTRVFLAADQLGLSDDEHQALADSVRDVLEEAGWRLHLLAPHWYLQQRSGQQDWRFSLANPNRCLGQDLNDLLPSPRAPGCQSGHQLFHELQMMLFQHPINLARRARGLPEANSLWFWGGGSWPQTYPPDQGLTVRCHGEVTSGHWAGLSACGFLLAAAGQAQTQSDGGTDNADARTTLWHWCPQPGERPSEALARLQQLLDEPAVRAALQADAGLQLVDDEGHSWQCSDKQRPRFWQWQYWRRPADLLSYWGSLEQTSNAAQPVAP